MADYQGKFQYLAAGGAASQDGACRVHFDAQTFTLTPESGAALVFDLGDLDAVTAANYEIRLTLYTGRAIVLRQLGRAFETLAHDLTDAFRNRAVKCLLLEDMSEITRFNATIELTGSAPASGAAEIRLYKSNLAVLPNSSAGFQWRLADIDGVKLDSAAFEVTVQSGENRLKVTRLAKRTEEFAEKTREARNALAANSTEALHAMLPFLDSDQLSQCSGILREGGSASLARLAAVHKQIPAALAHNAVDANLKPYYDALVSRAAKGLGYAGFKLIRAEERDLETEIQEHSDQWASDTGTAALDADSTGPETLYWFLYPLAGKNGTVGNVVAWEASSRAGRATYFFRIVPPAQAGQLAEQSRTASIVDASVKRLSRVLAMLNFRRRPIYLSDDELNMNPQFHRYAIAARRMPEVREVRASFLGRALHNSLETWQAQVEEVLSKA